MLVHKSEITPEMRDKYIIKDLTAELSELTLRKEYNQNCIVRKISRKEYAYA